MERFVLEAVFDTNVEAEQGNGEPADVDETVVRGCVHVVYMWMM
jgi:hypothetical protein